MTPFLKNLGFLKSKRKRAESEAFTTLTMFALARSLIADEENWVQGRYETIDGRRCAVGALRVAARMMGANGVPESVTGPLLSIAHERGFNDIEKMNDRSTHAQVLSAFDEAVSRL